MRLPELDNVKKLIGISVIEYLENQTEYHLPSVLKDLDNENLFNLLKALESCIEDNRNYIPHLWVKVWRNGRRLTVVFKNENLYTEHTTVKIIDSLMEINNIVKEAGGEFLLWFPNLHKSEREDFVFEEEVSLLLKKNPKLANTDLLKKMTLYQIGYPKEKGYFWLRINVDKVLKDFNSEEEETRSVETYTEYEPFSLTGNLQTDLDRCLLDYNELVDNFNNVVSIVIPDKDSKIKDLEEAIKTLNYTRQKVDDLHDEKENLIVVNSRLNEIIAKLESQLKNAGNQPKEIDMKEYVLKEEFNEELDEMSKIIKKLRGDISYLKHNIEQPKQPTGNPTTSIPYSDEAMHAGIRGMAGTIFNNAFSQPSMSEHGTYDTNTNPFLRNQPQQFQQPQQMNPQNSMIQQQMFQQQHCSQRYPQQGVLQTQPFRGTQQFNLHPQGYQSKETQDLKNENTNLKKQLNETRKEVGELIQKLGDKQFGGTKSPKASTPVPMFTVNDLNRLCNAIDISELMEKESLYGLLEAALPETYSGESIKLSRALKRVGKVVNAYVKERFGPVSADIAYSKKHKQIYIDISSIDFLTTGETIILKQIINLFVNSSIGFSLLSKI